MSHRPGRTLSAMYRMASVRGTCRAAAGAGNAFTPLMTSVLGTVVARSTGTGANAAKPARTSTAMSDDNHTQRAFDVRDRMTTSTSIAQAATAADRSMTYAMKYVICPPCPGA